jgi:hypothetical protein
MTNNIIIQRKINREMMRLEKYKTNHILHLLLSVFSMGFWLPVWALVSVSNANERMKSQKRLDSLEMSLSVCEVE